MRQWIKKICKFCGKDLGDTYFPKCNCPKWIAAEDKRQREWEEEHKDDPPEEDFDKVYPLIFSQHATGKNKARVGLDARKFKDGVGLCIFYPFWDEEIQDYADSGLCWDFAYEDLDAIYKLIREAKKAIIAYQKKENKNE